MLVKVYVDYLLWCSGLVPVLCSLVISLPAILEVPLLLLL